MVKIAGEPPDVPDPPDPAPHPHPGPLPVFLPPKPLPAQPPPPAGQTPSITSWARIETLSSDLQMKSSIAARLYDPLWMLTRQWQVGEFQGEDTGSPVVARTRARTTMLSRVYLGQLPPNTNTQGTPYDSDQVPLEVLVERRRVRPTDASIKQMRIVVEAGLHFLRVLEEMGPSQNYRDAFIACYPLALPDAVTLNALDAETRRYLLLMAGRTVDARLLETAFRPTGSSTPPLNPKLQIASGDRAEVLLAASQWLVWYDTLFNEPPAGSADTWIPDRLEYALSVAGRLGTDPLDETTLTASELYRGDIDWSDFDINAEVNLGTMPDKKFRPIVQTTIPAPITFPGMPAARFWEFEDAKVEYGLVPVGPTDLAQLLMIEYTSSYGNDWFVIPLDLSVGSLTSINSLVVTDTFGIRTLLRPLGDSALAHPFWSMFQHSYTRGTIDGARSNQFFLAPTLGRSLRSAPVEDVLFMRDEMANMAWAIERSIEGPLEQALSRVGPGGSTATAAAPVSNTSAASAAATALSAGTIPVYHLASTVPDYWVPLLPVQLTVNGATLSRLQRGAVLQPDGSRQIRHALGTLLNQSNPLLLHDEEVPREGVRVTRHYQMARWYDGATFTWIANRKQTGRGEGSSGLVFDTLAGS
jgi:hypothetical protein